MYYKKIAGLFTVLQGTDVRWAEYIYHPDGALNGEYITAPDDCYFTCLTF